MSRCKTYPAEPSWAACHMKLYLERDLDTPHNKNRPSDGLDDTPEKEALCISKNRMISLLPQD